MAVVVAEGRQVALAVAHQEGLQRPEALAVMVQWEADSQAEAAVQQEACLLAELTELLRWFHILHTRAETGLLGLAVRREVWA